MPHITHLKETSISCDCGCNCEYPLTRGWLEYGDDSALAFYLARFSHTGQASVLWILLGSGTWFDDDDLGCWPVLRNWVDDGQVIARVEDQARSPFRSKHIFSERFLARDEVLEREGALAWAIARREELLELHPASAEFLLAPGS